jgi:hypothetical protein
MIQAGKYIIKTKIYFVTLLSLAIWVFNSCGNKNGALDEDVLARVGQEYLLRSDVEAIFSGYQSPKDSASMAQNFIDDWVKRQVFLNQAKKNLSLSQSHFDKQVDHYRNALIVHAYENQLVEEHLDTLVTPKQLADFYEKTKESYRLKEDIIRARFVKFPVEISANLDKFKQLLQSTKPEDFVHLEDFCLNNSITYYLDFNKWLSFSDLLRDLPAREANTESYLRNNYLVELKDDYFKYFVYIFDHRKTGSTAPLSFEEDNIRNLILIQRKRELINKKRNQFLLEAKDRNMVEYN